MASTGLSTNRNINELRSRRFANIENAHFDLNYYHENVYTYEENEVEEAEKVLGALRYATHFR